MIVLTCDIKISAVHCLVFVTKHACDRQTYRRTDGQNYDSQDRASKLRRAVKTTKADRIVRRQRMTVVVASREWTTDESMLVFHTSSSEFTRYSDEAPA